VKATVGYPPARKGEVVDDFHGTAVPDPYRWLEDLDAEETRSWIEAQNRVTESLIAQTPGRDRFRNRLTDLWNYEKYCAESRFAMMETVPFRRGGRYFLFRNDGLQNQFAMYTADSLDAEPRLLLDPNSWSEDGTVALTGKALSKDGRKLAYGFSSAGSDWQEWKVVDVQSGAEHPDHLRWVKFSTASWDAAGEGFYYSRYDEPEGGKTKLQEVNYFQKLYYHRLGTDQAEDVLVYERPDQKEWGFQGRVTEDGRYLVIHVWVGTDPKNAVFYKDLSDPDSEVVELLREFDAAYLFVGNEGPVFWFLTDLEAPKGRMVAVDLEEPEPPKFRELIAEGADSIESCSLIGGRFAVSYLQDARTRIAIHLTDGGFEREVDLPGIGWATGFLGHPDVPETFYAFASFTSPPAIYHYDVSTGESELFRKPEVDFDPSQFETRQVFFTSKDGTRVPMFVTHRRGISLDGDNPTYLYGYGGFQNAMVPYFSLMNLTWMEAGGVFAMACIRGGGEYGEEWHLAGTKLQKQNVFDDFVSAAEWLIDNGYTSSSRLAIGGGSNGGLLVGACITQRPELFGAAWAAVGVMDMLRFNQFTIGWAWESDYGSPQDPEEFKALLTYSPLHNLRPAEYPATILTTGDHDDRVWPGHSFKFAAAMQEAQKGDAPVVIRVETRGGHGMGKPTWMLIEEVSDVLAFLAHHTGLTA
jgi:prolyl oligopeptidase